MRKVKLSRKHFHYFPLAIFGMHCIIVTYILPNKDDEEKSKQMKSSQRVPVGAKEYDEVW
jgi:glutaredoxin 2